MRWIMLVVLVFCPACLSRTAELPPASVQLPLCEGAAPADTVPEPAVAPPPISGGTLAVMPDGTIVAADPDRDQLYVVPPSDKVSTLALEAGSEPGRVVAGRPGRAFVALRRKPQVLELEVSSASIVARHDVCALPRGVAWSAERSTLYVACAGGELDRLSWSDPRAVRRTTLHVAPDLRDVVETKNGVLVSTFRKAELFEVGLDDSTRRVQGPVSSDFGTPRVAWRMTTGRGHILMTHQLETTRPLGTAACTDSPDGMEPLTPGVEPGGYGGMMPAVTSAVAELGQPAESFGGSPSLLVVGALPVDTAASVSGDKLAVVAAGSGEVSIRQRSGDVLRRGVVSPTAVAFRGEQAIVLSREPAMLTLDVGERTERTIKLSGSSRQSSSHDRFHQATRNGIACASCHPEAGDDAHTWTIAGVAVRTPSLRGGLKGTEPFHWQGDEEDVTQLMGDVFRKRMMGPRVSKAQAVALLDWLEAQPKLPAPAQDAAAVQRGAELFASAQTGCATCHTGQHGTNNQTMDVGTNGAFQVPRLDELAYRAPYFHDGRVPTLEERFGPFGGGDRHGKTSQLTAEQIADLVAYLKSR